MQKIIIAGNVGNVKEVRSVGETLQPKQKDAA